MTNRLIQSLESITQRSSAVSGIVGTLGILGFASCLPSFEDRPWLIEETRILAIRSVPAEQKPNLPVSLEVLVAGPQGTSTIPVDWNICLRPRTAVERSLVTSTCLEGHDLHDVAPTTIVSADACARFGPNPPPVEGGQVGQRPADPDPTGGYYLPVRASLASDSGEKNVVSFGQIRIRCDLAGATREIFDAYQAQYRENQNPEILDLRIVGESSPSDGMMKPIVSVGDQVDLTLEVDRESIESYVVYRADLARLIEAEEILHGSWFVSAGELDVDQAEQPLSHDDGSISTSILSLRNRWHAPKSRQSVNIWLVLRDNRGGSAWVERTISVQ